MGQLLVPALVGAGVGAVGGAATGNNPFKTALLGAGLGAGGAGLLGAGGATAGATGAGIQLTQPAIAEGLSTALAPSVVGGSGAAGITGLGTQALGGAGITGLGSGTLGAGGAAITGLNTIPLDSAINYNNLSRLAVDTPLSLGEQFTKMVTNPFTDLTTKDKLGIGLQTAGTLMQPQQMIQPQVQPIKQGNPEMVSTPLMNVGPNVSPTEGNKLGVIDMMAKIPMTDEERLRLQQLAQYGYRG
jgi:hypothetical protein